MSNRSWTEVLGLDRFSGLYLLALFIMMFGIWTPRTFLTTVTLRSIATQQAIPVIVALALLVPLAAGVFDLSVGASANLATILVTILQTKHHLGMWLAIVICVAVGVAIGAVNGALVTKLGLSSFIATLGMATVLLAMQEILSGQTQPNPVISSAWVNLTQYQVFGYQLIVVYMLGLVLFVWWVTQHTPAGRYLYAVGGNPQAARLAGVQVDKWQFLSLTFSATVASIAGVLYASLSGPSLTYGSALLLPAFAACFLGSTQLQPGRFNVWGSVLAVYVLATGVKGMQLVTFVQWLNDLFNGVALISAVAFAVWWQRRKTERTGSMSAERQRGGGMSDDLASGSKPASPINAATEPAAGC